MNRFVDSSASLHTNPRSRRRWNCSSLDEPIRVTVGAGTQAAKQTFRDTRKGELSPCRRPWPPKRTAPGIRSQIPQFLCNPLL